MNPRDATRPIDLFFGGMEKLGPGSNPETLRILRLLPRRQFRLVIDAGSGTGRQTIALARELQTPIHAVDSYEPFLLDLERRARAHGVGRLVHTHLMDMKDIPEVFANIDLLWSEGAAYNIGFAHALAHWTRCLGPDGLVVVSELSWVSPKAPAEVREFFRSGYPGMQSVGQNTAAAEGAGYQVLATHTLPGAAWFDGYYDILEPRARSLIDHAEASVRDFATEILREIEVFRRSEGSYGYVFYVLQRA